MLTDVTELSPQEQQTARLRLGELADRFTVDGTLRTAAWQAVYRRTWRHPYVPCYYPERARSRWLAAVYSNETLITKVTQVPARQGGSYPRFTSSSTLPSLLLTMLEALEITDGCRMLEIGTGSGYNAALLCERLGSEHVTSVDIDPDLVALARERLAANGDIGLQLEAPDGSGAQAWHTPGPGGFLVRQSGPRRLWDRVEEAHQFWQRAGRPNPDRFGITATHTTEQYVWYDHPDSPHRWRLPTPTSPPTAGDHWSSAQRPTA